MLSWFVGTAQQYNTMLCKRLVNLCQHTRAVLVNVQQTTAIRRFWQGDFREIDGCVEPLSEYLASLPVLPHQYFAPLAWSRQHGG